MASPDPKSSNRPVAISGTASIASVVVAKSERTYAESFGSICSRVYPEAEIEYHNLGSGLVASLQGRRINFLLIGLSFPDTDGVDLIKEICKHRLAEHIVVIAEKQYRPLLASLHTSRVDAIIDTFGESIGCIKAALRLVQKGEVYISPALQPFMQERHPSVIVRSHLTPAELRVLRVIGSGCDNQEAAAMLSLSEATVHAHRRSIMHKFKVSSSARLVHEAIRLGFVRVPTLDSVTSDIPAPHLATQTG